MSLISDKCTNIPDIDKLRTEQTFQVDYGAAVIVGCEEGNTLSGDGTITCKSGNTFTWNTEPQCVIGKTDFIKLEMF